MTLKYLHIGEIGNRLTRVAEENHGKNSMLERRCHPKLKLLI